MRVLMIVQLVDEREWLRSFTVDWIRALAAQVDRLDVITLEMGEAALPDNVFVQSMGKERGYGRVHELWAFQRALWRVIRNTDVVFSHMTPRYTWLAAPQAALFRKPQMLWFTHRQVSPELRMAHACGKWITTATYDSFPLDSPKVHVMGHGINTELFAPDARTPPDDPPLVVAVGRVSPIKHHHTLLEAAALLRDQYDTPPVRFAVVGGTAAPGDEAYRTKLLRRRDELGLSADDFALPGAVPTPDVIALYRRATIATNLSPAGLFDKAALEAMLTGVPVIVSNAAFDDLLGAYQPALRVSAPDDSASVAARLAGLLALTPEQRAAMGRDLRAATAATHGLERLMTRMVSVMQGSSDHD